MPRKKSPSPATIAAYEHIAQERLNNPPIREAIEFYRHKHNWSNRLVYVIQART
jgi:adenine-specific DNA-methyltransferase